METNVQTLRTTHSQSVAFVLRPISYTNNDILRILIKLFFKVTSSYSYVGVAHLCTSEDLCVLTHSTVGRDVRIPLPVLQITATIPAKGAHAAAVSEL